MDSKERDQLFATIVRDLQEARDSSKVVTALGDYSKAALPTGVGSLQDALDALTRAVGLLAALVKQEGE